MHLGGAAPGLAATCLPWWRSRRVGPRGQSGSISRHRSAGIDQGASPPSQRLPEIAAADISGHTSSLRKQLRARRCRNPAPGYRLRSASFGLRGWLLRRHRPLVHLRRTQWQLCCLGGETPDGEPSALAHALVRTTTLTAHCCGAGQLIACRQPIRSRSRCLVASSDAVALTIRHQA